MKEDNSDGVERKISSQQMDTLEWLKTNAPEVFNAQRHLDAGSEAQKYWHYGRWSALKDSQSALRPSDATAMVKELRERLRDAESWLSGSTPLSIEENIKQTITKADKYLEGRQ